MAEQRVAIDGAASTAAPASISQGGNTANVSAGSPNLGAFLLVSTGTLIEFVSLNAAATNQSGAVMDTGAGHANCTMVSVGTGTLTGTITLFGSVDGTTFVSTGATITVTAGSTLTATSSAKAFRHYRADLSGVGGTGTVTVKLMAS